MSSTKFALMVTFYYVKSQIHLINKTHIKI